MTTARKIVAAVERLPAKERRKVLAMLARVRRVEGPTPPVRPPRRARAARPPNRLNGFLALLGSLDGAPADVASRVDEYLADAALRAR